MKACAIPARHIPRGALASSVSSIARLNAPSQHGRHIALRFPRNSRVVLVTSTNPTEILMHLPSHVSAALLALALAISGITSATAFEQRKFDSASFKAAQAANKSILVDIWASWCPTCKAQHVVLDSLATKPEYARVVVFQVDF